MSVPAETLKTLSPPDDGRLVALAAPESLAAEQYRLLMARLDRAAGTRPMRTVAISSCGRGEGRSLTAVNLALTAAGQGREVAVVECDLRRPSLATMLDLAPRAGLAEVVAGKADLPQALARSHGVAVLCAGSTDDAQAVWRSPRLATTLETLRSSFSMVLLDAPPALAFSDSGRLAAAADGVLLVVRAGETPREVVRMALDALGDKVVGIVLNGVEQNGYARYLRNDAMPR